MTIGDRTAHFLAIILAIRCHRSNVGIDLIEQVRYFRYIANIVRRQFHRDDFMRVSIHAKVKLVPPPMRPDTKLLIEPSPSP
jgi:hypothetical protein